MLTDSMALNFWGEVLNLESNFAEKSFLDSFPTAQVSSGLEHGEEHVRLMKANLNIILATLRSQQ